MEWHDNGIILNLRKYGEFDAIIDVFTREHGRHSGIVKGGMGRRQRGNIQPGNEVDVTWRGRLETHLGTYSVELKNARAVSFLYSPGKLAALNSCSSLLTVAMAENEPHALLLDGFIAFMDALEAAKDDITNWGPLLTQWELGLLGELGFGLNLECCAATGITDDLIYVSPKSGRAVSRDAGKPYHDKMLPLPAFLLKKRDNIPAQDVLDGFHLTEFFMERHMLAPFGKKIPQARRMLLDHIP
ncbi:DNA repair protein RecO [Pseudemcibacter aquimaris]|uniref:DNA repair protein RecO n=1 Tax=Pseudemcibacter aquimaris TaxID=2857064 RepID=UPI002012B31D|nr:DNA repair protein RecO [Pseudemcibacter aquimaris]MCC3861016.1 DNA repair protein RecO [Pseudemcibacter aquimaris]WDU59834.1 DNA repair protein RecO [Pseudemcibacter aquimaris]